MLPFQFYCHLSNNTSVKVFIIVLKNREITGKIFLYENQPYLDLLLYPNEHSFGFFQWFTDRGPTQRPRKTSKMNFP